jgi:hypothetical protein
MEKVSQDGSITVEQVKIIEISFGVVEREALAAIFHQ